MNVMQQLSYSYKVGQRLSKLIKEVFSHSELNICIMIYNSVYFLCNLQQITWHRRACILPSREHQKCLNRHLDNKISGFNNEVYFVMSTKGESVDLQDDIKLRSLMISSTKLGILVGDKIVKNNCLAFGFGVNKKVKDFMQQAHIIVFDLVRVHPLSADVLKTIDNKISIPQAHGSVRYQERIPLGRLHVKEKNLNQNIQRVLKQVRLFAKYSKKPAYARQCQMEDFIMDAAYGQELDTLKQKWMRIFICRKKPVDFTHSRFNIKPSAENVILSASTYLFRSCSTGRELPFVSSCPLGVSILQLSIPFLPRKESKRRLQFQNDNAAVDSSNVKTTATAQRLISNEHTPLPVMSVISLVEGGHILFFLLSKNT